MSKQPTEKQIQEALDALANEGVPEKVNLWPSIREKMVAERQTSRVEATRPSMLRRKPGFSLRPAALALAALLAVSALTAAAYSFARDQIRAGATPTQAVALVTSPQAQPTQTPLAPSSPVVVNPNATAALQPTFTLAPTLPAQIVMPPTPTITAMVTATSAPEVARSTPSAPPAAMLSAADGFLARQVEKDIAVTLDWAYLDEERLVYQYTITGLPVVDGIDLSQVVIARNLASERLVPPSGEQPPSGSEGGEYTAFADGEGTRLRVMEVRPAAVSAGVGDPVPFSVDIIVGGEHAPVWGTAPDGSHVIERWVEIPPLGVFHFDFSIPFYPSIRLEPGVVSEASGVKLALETLRVSPSAAEAVVCFTPPTPSDWRISHQSTLQIGSSGPELVQSQVLVAHPEDTEQRCMLVRFHTLSGREPASALLVIPQLTAAPDLANRYDEARRQLATEGIVVEQAAGSGGSDIRIIAKPAGMSDNEVFQRLLEASRESLAGPWVFTVQIPAAQ